MSAVLGVSATPTIESFAAEGAVLDLRVNPRKLARFLSWNVLILDAAYIFFAILVFCFEASAEHTLLTRLNLDAEKTLPSLYSSSTLLFASALLAFVSVAERRRMRPCIPWRILSLIFAFLAADEWFSIHERLRLSDVSLSGIFHWTWVIPYSFLSVALGMVYLPFLRRLPARTGVLFVIAGLTYVIGAIGGDMVGGLIVGKYGMQSPAYALEVLAEESMEMGAIVLFIYALVRYIQTEFQGLNLRVRWMGQA